jgi:hypothetical protein
MMLLPEAASVSKLEIESTVIIINIWSGSKMYGLLELLLKLLGQYLFQLSWLWIPD